MSLLKMNGHEGLWSKKEEFWRNNPMVVFGKNVYKRDFLPFSTEMYFWEEGLKVTSYKERFMGKVLKVFFPFSTKI